ncbi:hypothetical protein B0A55_06072 [Friedmanniomyces simplex]|uniref:Uncharacterized protein n=1 Tax=Friedmanniomyces simplex TaxID=329884 RepID=A0A4V5NG33_9PEZI|nr:hypothetical protein B0A55_06072 [Friedmanniomyces simplex]
MAYRRQLAQSTPLQRCRNCPAAPSPSRPYPSNDADSLRCILSIPENTRLFAQIYGNPYENLAHLRYIFITHLDDPSAHGQAHTIKTKAAGSAIRWVIARCDPNNADDSPAFCAVFLFNTQRTLRISETIYILARHFFEQSSCETMTYRTGQWSHKNGLATGLDSSRSIDGILRRPLLVPERKAVTDLFRVRKDQWPSVKKAEGAWMGISDCDGEATEESECRLRAYVGVEV